MKHPYFSPIILAAALTAVHLSGQQTAPVAAPPVWETVETIGKPHARHEAALVSMGDLLYLFGGRGIKPVDVFNPASKTWTEGAAPPVEIHHFQPVVIDQKIWSVGAMTGKYPKEQALDHIPIYDPTKDAWSRGGAVPEGRRRGGAGAVVHEGKLYVVCGIINGHWDGNVAWLDVCDLKTGEWSLLPDAPRARDHFQAAVINGKIYAAGGRQTSGATNQVFDLVVPEVDVFDIKSGSWSTVAAIPTPRAGTSSIALNHTLIIAGGESIAQKEAHSQVERFDPKTGQWNALSSLARGRHGTGLVWLQNGLHTAVGCGNRGGSPELDSLERLEIQGD